VDSETINVNEFIKSVGKDNILFVVYSGTNIDREVPKWTVKDQR